jgi:hypothetical protein
MFNRVYYQSKIAHKFGPLTVLSLQKKCLRRNTDDSVTSFMYYDGRCIFQVLEGLPEVVEATLSRIAANPLHRDIRIRAMMRCPERKFAHWPFGATHSSDADFKRVMNASQQSDFFALDVLQAERLLSIIASRKRRAVKVDQFSVKVRNFTAGRHPRGLFSIPEPEDGHTRGRIYVQNEMGTLGASAS